MAPRDVDTWAGLGRRGVCVRMCVYGQCMYGASYATGCVVCLVRIKPDHVDQMINTPLCRVNMRQQRDGFPNQHHIGNKSDFDLDDDVFFPPEPSMVSAVLSAFCLSVSFVGVTPPSLCLSALRLLSTPVPRQPR